jgi:predicted NBD/HSP70 family sugar kinase
MPMLATRPDSPGHLLWLVRTGVARTRTDLQRATGLSRSTVVQRLDVLLAAGLIRVAGATPSTGGRPAERLDFNPAHGVLLAAQMGADGTRTAVLDVGGQLLADDRGEIGAGADSQSVIAWLTQSFDRILSATGWKPDQVRGVAVGMSPTKDDPALAGLLSAGWECPVLVERATDLIALGERASRGGDGGTLLLLHLGTTVDAGLIVRGAIHHGAAGAAGDLGHVRVPELATVRCECGAYGCLSAGAGSRALAARLTALGVPTRPGPQLAARIRARHPDVTRLIRTAGGLLGRALAPAVQVIDPDDVVIVGDISGPELLAGFADALRSAGLPRLPAVSNGTAAVQALSAGAHRLLVERVYAPPAVDDYLLGSTAPAAGFAGLSG